MPQPWSDDQQLYLPSHLMLEHFYTLGNDRYVLLNSPLPEGDSIELSVETDPDLYFGLMQIDRLKLGSSGKGVYVGYRVLITGKTSFNPYLLLSYRGTDKLKARLKQKDYPQLLVKLDGMKVIGNNTMTAAVSSKPFPITQHLEHP